MSILKEVLNLVGLGEQHPELPAGHPAAARLRQQQAALVDLAKQTHDRLEFVPGEGTDYVFIGKPPKAFGVVWLRDGKVSNLKTLVDEHGVSMQRLDGVVESLREAYERSASVERYQAKVEGHELVVAPVPDLAQEMGAIIDAVVAERAAERPI